uniref:Methyltransferase type 11 domain-containing protein n=1 Tax=Corethron hystrix TaxID=216773 RepID=A0A7S1B7R6_9STRA|mmetsp:Transcript_16374/g.36833  ORF Transcript_16374/g.36833 Transcript_16374/m.36833 type:complete len:304 (+) Transcript_16374:149-1060(+)|eukprot:CAMPEP_0113309610 /NCGR_PEP_ID=MMETSP0010_2-20120614/7583_1 /TAXON_ID=216773 ORGANISM="Corethron hystrix, Strain 308" /NCGR_SAMPLE_ID=MMETSP0010_2 /ASSEMBLY_ACC=CAM_ASM_000155 /LENGTH=303 /DNA_ID=CAMNT_0000164893 /DNA_START=59 /DNA_END=970 /DNA_ORIENTATION=+ /assembly_acc=CAM_ASM_000155
MSTEEIHDSKTYQKSGDMDKHLEGVKKQYDTKEKREFYSQVMGDGTANIHFGKWDGVDVEAEGAYGRASDNLTDYMFEVASGLCEKKEGISYVDLGSGSGGAAVRLLAANPSLNATCVNLCPDQNAGALKDAESKGVQDRIKVVTSSYDQCPLEGDMFDLAFSQDAYVHSYDKVVSYSEARRLVKSGGVFILCDLMCGDGPDVSDEELATFAATNMVNDWLTPEKNCEAARKAGWTDVEFINLTTDIRKSFQLMKKKVDKIIANGGEGIDMSLLTEYSSNLEKRVGHVDKGVFKWGVIHAKNP